MFDCRHELVRLWLNEVRAWDFGFFDFGWLGKGGGVGV